MSRDTVDPDGATHQADDLATDNQPQPGAAEGGPNGGIGLGEFFEQPLLLVGGDADAGVLDLAVQGGNAVFDRLDPDPDRDVALVGEFHRIATEVDQHLPQSPGVTDEAVGNVLVDEDRHCQGFGLGLDHQ